MASGNRRAKPALLWRASGAPSRAKRTTPAIPASTAARTLSKPPTARPARRARPIVSRQRSASNCSTRSASPGGDVGGDLAARSDHEAQQGGAVADFTGHEAPPPRPASAFLVGRRRVDWL